MEIEDVLAAAAIAVGLVGIVLPVLPGGLLIAVAVAGLITRPPGTRVAPFLVNRASRTPEVAASYGICPPTR